MIPDFFPDANGEPHPLPPGEKVHWRISGYAIACRDGSVLMVTPSWSPLWELPGGGVEECESIAGGIQRECYEETGYHIAFLSGLPFHVSERNFYHRHEKKFYHSIVMVYLVEISSMEGGVPMPPPEEWDEIQKVEWVCVDNLNDQNCHPVIWPAISFLKGRPLS